MKRSDHEASCVKYLGQPFTHVHWFMDQYFKEIEFKRWAWPHWLVLHHKPGIEKVVEQYGEEARAAAERHILDDMGVVVADPVALLGALPAYTLDDVRTAIDLVKKVYGHDFDLEEAYKLLKQ